MSVPGRCCRVWSLTSLRTKRISGPRKFRSSPPKDFCNKIGTSRHFAGLRNLFAIGAKLTWQAVAGRLMGSGSADMIGAIDPMDDRGMEIVHEAQRLGPKSLDIFADVFWTFARLNPSLIAALKMSPAINMPWLRNRHERKNQPHPGTLGMGRSQGPRPGEGRCLCADSSVIRATKRRDRGQVRSRDAFYEVPPGLIKNPCSDVRHSIPTTIWV